MAAQKEKEQRFDQGKLQGMHEPLTVRVEKMRGNVRQPIELPSKGSEQNGFSPPGSNWTRDEVLGLENFILTKWSGGGYYEFTVTDAKADRMTWQGVWDPRLYPERIPPNTAEAAVVGAAQTTTPIAGPQPMPPGVQPFGSSMQNNWPPSGNQLGYNNPPHSGPVMGMMPQGQPQQQQPSYAPQPGYAPQQAPMPQAPQAPPMWNPQAQWQAGYGAQPGYGSHPGYGPSYGGRSRFIDDDPRESRRTRAFERDHHDDDKEKRELRERELEQKLRQAELSSKEMEYKATLDRIQQQQSTQIQQMQQQHATQMQTLQEELRRIGEARNKGEDDEVRRMREESQKHREHAQAEVQRLREQAQAEQALLQRQLQEQQIMQMRQASEAQVAAIREQLSRMAEAPRGENDEVRQLRMEQERQRQDTERVRQETERRLEAERLDRERERERYERERRDEVFQRELRSQEEARARRDEMMQRDMKEQREATERRIEQLAQNNRANDPMIDAMKENARLNAEQMREIARMQTDSTNRMSQFMVAPMQLAQIMKENSSGSDGLMRNVVDSVSGIVGMYKNAAETIMQMSGGGGDPPAARLIQEGIGRASEVAEKFLAVKRDQVISESKVKQAEAMRDQTKIQADAHLRATQMQTQAAMATGRQWSPPPPVASSNSNSGLGGVQAHPSANGQHQQAAQATQTAQAPAAKPKRTGMIDDQVPDPAQPKRTGMIDDQVPDPAPPPNSTGPSEEEVFGVALESVLRLRRGVAENKLTPDKVIDAILQGVEHVVTNNIVIPAFVLFQQERWADFIDVMLPEAPQDFRAECVRIMIEEVEVTPEGESS